MKVKKQESKTKNSPVCNIMKLEFPSHSRNEAFARAAAGAFIAALDPTSSELSDIKCALSEAVTNCIVHAYPDKIGMIRLEIKLRTDGTVIMSVKDKGIGIPDIGKAREPLFTTDALGERSGMGFTVMEGFSDSVKIKSTPGKGTVVTMTRKLSGKSSF